MTLRDFAKIHVGLSDPIRIRMIALLLERELCVCEIEQLVRRPQYQISRHLGLLKKAGLVRDWREGRWIHYEIHPNLEPALKHSLNSLAKMWIKERIIFSDVKRLRASLPRKAGQRAAMCR